MQKNLLWEFYLFIFLCPIYHITKHLEFFPYLILFFALVLVTFFLFIPFVSYSVYLSQQFSLPVIFLSLFILYILYFPIFLFSVTIFPVNVIPRVFFARKLSRISVNRFLTLQLRENAYIEIDIKASSHLYVFIFYTSYRFIHL